MIDSIFTGSSGVRSHQTQMNVITNNIANVNTTAFKSGRASFVDILSRTLGEGTPAGDQRSATNPQQSGLGVTVGSIDTIQRQGMLQTTGIETDLAIEGEGFFILGSGNGRAYTRDGTFDFDVEGRLFDPGSGLLVQGHLAQADGRFGAELENVVIPLDRESPPKATSQISLSGNLPADRDQAEGGAVWRADTRFGLPARIVADAGLVFPLDLSGMDGAGLTISLQRSDARFQGVLAVPARDYPQVEALIAELNSQIAASGALKDKAFFTTGEAGELVLRTVEGGAELALTIENTDPVVDIASRLGLAAGVQQWGERAAATDSLNSLANVGQPLTGGDLLRFSGVKPNGERFDGQFLFTAETGDRMADLFRAIEAVYGGVQAGLDPETGQLILTDPATQNRVVGFEINLSLLDQGHDSGIFGAAPPFEYTTTTQIVDAKGHRHSLNIAFTKGTLDNEWSWIAKVDGLIPDAGHYGRLSFNDNGTLRTFEAADKSDLVFTPADGAPPFSIAIGASATQRLGGLTQFTAPASAAVGQQDGRTSGKLSSIAIEPNGTIVGLFTNNSAEDLARIALATFGNVDGLKQQANNLFVESQASGKPVVGVADSTVQGRIYSGTVEMSNVDLAQEFTNMIVTQRGFQASARSITTSDELLAEVVNLKR